MRSEYGGEYFPPLSLSFRGSVNVPDGVITDPKLEKSAIRLDPFGWVIREANSEEIVSLSSGYLMTVVPPKRPYIDGDRDDNHRIAYLVSGDGLFKPSCTDIDPSVGGEFLGEIGRILKEDGEEKEKREGRLVVGLNISSPMAAFAHGQGPFPNHTAQSAPFPHVHLLHISPQQLDAFNSEDTNMMEALEAKITGEMKLDKEEIERRGGVLSIVQQMVYDAPSIQNWQNKGIGVMMKRLLKNGLYGGWSVNWREPNSEETPPFPYGLEFVFPADVKNISGAFDQYRQDIWTVLTALENKLGEKYGDDPYNFTVLFIKENGRVKMVICPHDAVRAGVTEAMGIICVRSLDKK